SGTSIVGNEPPHLRSVWTAISTGMAVEHFYAGVGGSSQASSGDLRPGGSRAFVDVQSASSVPSQGTGRLFFASDTSRLLVYDSGGTYMVGTAFGEEQLSVSAGSGFWAIQTGSVGGTAQSGNVTNTFPIPFLLAPTLIQQTIQSGATGIWHAATTRSTTTFNSTWSALGASASTST